MNKKRIDLYGIIDEWFIPITLIEIFVLMNVLIISLILKRLGLI